MESYSMDLRERVVRACDEQIGTRMEIAEMFKVSTAWVRRLLQRRRETGNFLARPRGGRRFAAFDPAGLKRLKSLVAEQPDATLEELLDRCGVEASIMAVHRALERLGCRRKKSRSTRPNRVARTS
jgi:transposase